MSAFTITVDNVYENGDEIRTEHTLDAPPPEVEDVADEYEEWAEDHLFPLTGTGRPNGDASYFVEITRFDDRPDLVGRTFEYGI